MHHGVIKHTSGHQVDMTVKNQVLHRRDLRNRVVGRVRKVGKVTNGNTEMEM